MLRFLTRRLANSLVLVILATSLAFLLAATSLTPRSNFQGRNPPPPERVVDRQLDELNLNDKTPLLDRYTRWAGDVLHGDFGRTWDGISINKELARRVGVSLRLVLFAAIVGSILGIAAGAWGAVRQYRASDHLVTIGSFVILATPVFVLAIVLEILAVGINNAVGAKVFLYTGETTPALSGGFWTHLVDRVQHLIVPSLALILGQIAIFSRYQRNALRTALIPAVTFLAYDFGLLLVGATFTEKIFGWHGMGEWFVDSVTRQDVNAVAAVSCFAAVLVLLAGLMSDVAYAILDPRIRVQ
jgi:peptide/nickel transport system permease protein